MRFLLFYVTFLFHIICVTQISVHDSNLKKQISLIKNAINKAENDTVKINLYVEYEYLIYEIDKELSDQINQKIIKICNHNLQINKQNKKFFLKQKSLALSNLGYNAQIKGELKKALVFYNNAVKIDKEIHNKRSIAASYSNIGAIYDYMGDYLNSIAFYQKSLKIQKEIGNKRGESDLYNNFGVIYNTLRQYDKSLDYYNKSLKIDQELKDESAQLVTLNNIGSLYAKQLQFEKAIEITMKSLEKSIHLKDEIGIAMTRGNIGSYYYELNQLDSAQYYLEFSINNFRKQNNLQHLATFLPFYAKVKKDKGQYNQALKLAKESYQLSIETGDLSNKHASAITLYNLYKSKNNFKEALKFYEIYESLENQIQNDANKKQLLGFEFDKKMAEDSLKNSEKIKRKNTALILANKKNELNKERIIYLILGILILIIAVGFVFNRFQITKKQKLTIENQKSEVEKQKMIIEDINQQIHDSIKYAEMIQQAVLPILNVEKMFEQAFVIYQPKDIVSGDFYWLEKENNNTYFCVADCTGHGIPGAFISMIGTILLNEIFNSKRIKQPDLVLNELSRLVQLTLMTKENQVLNDGMDISFCHLNTQNNELNFAGANNGIYILSKKNELKINNELISPKLANDDIYLYKIAADKKPIGKHYSNETNFSLNTINLFNGDLIILLSDGYADQFGGKKNKKFKAGQFEELLLDNFHLNIIELKINILLKFNDWKGINEQVDDVCMIGVRIKND